MSELSEERNYQNRRRLINRERCPFCKAFPDKPCTLGGGEIPMSRPHMARVLAAIDTQKAQKDQAEAYAR